MSDGWQSVRRELRRSLPGLTFDRWLAPLRPLVLRGETLYLTGPDSILRWAERRYAPLVRRAAAEAIDGVSEVAFVGEDVGVDETTPPSGGGGGLALNRANTFERFVIGDGNRIAHAAALAVAEAPGEAYNPLFLHGPPGLGKTHLLGAIGSYLRRRHPEISVRCTSAECFANEFVAALNTGEMDDFKRRHRGVGALFVDDVQFLEGKPRIAEEFFHTFNALYESGAQLVLSADRVPAELRDLTDRLRGRLEWGLLVELGAPDIDTRRLITRRLAIEAGLEPEPTAIEAIASADSGNVRRLSGTVTRTIAVGSITGAAFNDALVASTLRLGPTRAERVVTVEEIQDAVEGALGIRREQLLSSSRAAPVVQARQLAMHLCRQLTELSLPAIARAFGRRDHTTVINAIQRVDARLEQEPAVQDLHSRLRDALHPSRDSADRQR